jgi:hypothetical protein
MPRRGIARRLMSRLWSRFARRAGRGQCLWLALSVAAAPLSAEGIGPDDIGHWSPDWTDELLAAEFTHPTTRYAHGVLGDAIEWSGLSLRFVGQGGAPWGLEIALPADHVFEDLEPRLIDLNLGGRPNAVMVVETDMALGAALALYSADGKIAETPHIGRSNRWLAPIGAADLDGDGHVELAYVDRPHLAKTLRVWRFEAGGLIEVSSKTGLTNHRIGDNFITSGIRTCANGPEVITVDANWHRLVASRLSNGQINSRDIGAFSGPASLQAALACR